MTQAVRVAVAAAEVELAADALWQAGAVAVEERPGELVAATTAGGDPARLLAAVAGRWQAVVEEVDLEGALDAWRDHARPAVVGSRLVVHPPWVPVPAGLGAGRRAVVIDPGRAFGHGAHPSTRLVLEALDGGVRGGERVLDIGCGSGVLAIAALALGATSAVAVDVDPAARRAASANAARNGLADCVTMLAATAHLYPGGDVGPGAASGADDPGPAGRDPGTPAPAGPADATADHGFDLVVANLLLPDLVGVAPIVARALARGGTAVLSGVLTGQRGDVEAAYASAGLAPVAETSDDGWLAITLRAR